MTQIVRGEYAIQAVGVDLYPAADPIQQKLRALLRKFRDEELIDLEHEMEGRTDDMPLTDCLLGQIEAWTTAPPHWA